MSRDYCTPGPPFLYTGGEPGSGGMDCLHNHHHNHHHQLRQPPAVVSTTPVPFHYLISEQAKSFVVLQELQHEVGALLEFRDLVIETFPSLRTKMAAAAGNPSTTSSVPAAASTPISSSSTTAALMLLSSTSGSNIPVAIRHRDWEPGIRVRRKLNVSSSTGGGGKKSESTIQDSGFSTETSSKETHSSSAANSSNSSQTGGGNTDELWNLLDVIHRKGTRLKDEVEALQGTIANQSHFHEETDFQRYLFHGSADDLRQLRVERDHLLDRLAEMEAEVMASRAHTTRMREDFEVLAATRVDLETQLRAMVDQRGAVNDRIGDLHAEFVTGSDRTKDGVQLVGREAVLDTVLGASVPKVKQTETCKVAAILQERNPLVLQKHLLTTTVRNQVLQEQLDSASKLEVGLATKLDKARVENDELKFQLKDKNIELEGTLALVRMLELRQHQQQQKQPASSLTTSSVHSSSTIRSPDIIPLSDLTSTTGSTLIHEQQRPLSRTEITTSSMKAMSPFPQPATQQPLNNLDHSSSTESAHDQTESVRNAKSAETPRRKPSKIPLVKNPAPKPPNASTPSLRSRSGEPTPSSRHHYTNSTSANSTHSWRLKTQHNNTHNNNPADHTTVTNNSLNTSKSTGSLVSHTRHHHHNLSTSTSSSILRSGGGGGGNNPRDSLNGQTTAQSYKSVTSHKSVGSSHSNGSSGRFRKTSPSVRRAATLRDTSTSNSSIGGGVMVTSDTSKRKDDSGDNISPWAVTSSLHATNPDYLDSLDYPNNTLSGCHNYQTTAAAADISPLFLWQQHSAAENYYDSINSATMSSYYQQHGAEQMAECDSLERHKLSMLSGK